MKQIAINPSNEPYYSEDFIKGFKCGTQRQLESDKADIPRWISCSERLPSENGSYLTWSVIGFVPDHVDEPNTYEGIAVARFSKELCVWFGTEKVLAWMPLEPWEGADDE